MGGTEVDYISNNKDAWEEATQYASKIFTSFSHTLSDIINSVVTAGMAIKKLNEYDYDIGLTNAYDNKGYPLSFILLAQKF